MKETRGQLSPGPMPSVVTIVTLLIASVVGLSALGAIGSQLSDESKYGPDVCEDRLAENATWINGSDGTVDCRWPNGTVVEDVPAFKNLTGGGQSDVNLDP